MAYTSIDNPELYFQTVLWSGDSTSPRTITFDGSEDMQPDWIWSKKRNSADYGQIYDSVRTFGAGKEIVPSDNFDEGNSTNNSTALGNISSVTSDGFVLTEGNHGTSSIRSLLLNHSGSTHVAWGWKMGTSFSNDASATSVGSIDSSGSINTTAGQSIISWTGSGSGATIAHGLGIQPQIVFVKNRDDTASWNVYTVVGGGGKGLFLNENNGYDSDSSYFNNGTASTTTFPVGTANTANGSSDDMIAYCFGNVKGYSKIGAYTGNANADGTFVYTGFKPAFVMIKNTAASEHWRIYDNKRDTFNHMYHVLFPNENSAESTVNNASEEIDFLSNGVKIRSSAAQLNGSGQILLYMAFAESPLVNSNGVPNNAR